MSSTVCYMRTFSFSWEMELRLLQNKPASWNVHSRQPPCKHNGSFAHCWRLGFVVLLQFSISEASYLVIKSVNICVAASVFQLKPYFPGEKKLLCLKDPILQ